MKSYGQFCPVAKAAEVFCERWTPLILRDLSLGATRFCELQRGVPLASPTLLSQRLKLLEAEGIVARRRSASGRSWTYHLTDAGREFTPIVLALGTWGQRWARRALAQHEVDLGLLLWALERGARPDALGPDRTVVEIELTDQPKAKRRWWFLNENGICELCLKKPDRDSDLFIGVTLQDLIYIWRGDLKLSTAIGTGRLEVHGTARARRGLSRWLAVSPLAEIQSQAKANCDIAKEGAPRLSPLAGRGLPKAASLRSRRG
jgi:DNA-binding HxlR family transcriptional regulator